MFAPHRKHITSPPRAQQVNAICRFWRCYINITITVLDIIQCPVFCLNTTALRPDLSLSSGTKDRDWYCRLGQTVQIPHRDETESSLWGAMFSIQVMTVDNPENCVVIVTSASVLVLNHTMLYFCVLFGRRNISNAGPESWLQSPSSFCPRRQILGQCLKNQGHI
jgi:hypothetical protein